MRYQRRAAGLALGGGVAFAAFSLAGHLLTDEDEAQRLVIGPGAIASEALAALGLLGFVAALGSLLKCVEESAARRRDEASLVRPTLAIAAGVAAAVLLLAAAGAALVTPARASPVLAVTIGSLAGLPNALLVGTSSVTLARTGCGAGRLVALFGVPVVLAQLAAAGSALVVPNLLIYQRSIFVPSVGGQPFFFAAFALWAVAAGLASVSIAKDPYLAA